MNQQDALKLAKEALDRALQEKKMSQELIKSLGPAILDSLRPSIEQMSANALLSREELLEAIAGIKINVPETNVPEARVTVEIPKFEIPTPIVNYTPPEVKIDLASLKVPAYPKIPKPEVTVNFDASKIRIPDIKMPDSMDVSGWIGLMGYDKGLLTNPLPVQIRDAKGNPINLGGTTSVGGSSFPMAAFDQATQAIKVTGSFSISASNSSTQVIDSSGNPYNATNPFPVSATFSGSTLTTLINNDGLAYNSDNPLPVTGTFNSTPGLQVSGASDSVNVAQYGGTTVPSGLNETTGGTFRTVQMTDSISSVNVVTTVGLTDTQLRAAHLDVQQISGAVDSVAIIGTVPVSGPLTDTQLRASSIDVQIASGAAVSVNVISDAINLDQTTDSISVAQVSGANYSVNVTNPVNQGDAATALRVVIAGNSDASVTATQAGTWNIGTVTTVTGITNSLATSLIDSSGVQYSGSNPIPVTITSGGTATSATNIVDSSGVAYSGSNPIPVTLSGESITLDQTTDSVSVAQVSGAVYSVNVVSSIAQGDSATAVRVVVAGNSDASVSATQVGTWNIGTVTTVTSITNTVTTRLDSPDGAYSGSNPLPVTLISGSISSTRAQIGNSDGDFSVANPLPVTFSAAASQNVNIFDGQASSVTSHQFLTDFRGLDTYVGGAAQSTFSEILNTDGRVKAEIVSIAGLNETNVGVQRTVLMTDSTSSVNVTTFNGNAPATGLNETTAGVLRTVMMTDSVMSVNVVSEAVTLSTQTDTVGTQQVSGAVDSVFVVGPIAQGDSTSALRTIQAGDSSSSVAASQVGTWNIGTVTTVTGITNSLASNIIDSSGVAYSGSNPVPVTLISGALTSTLVVGDSAQRSADNGGNPVKVGGIARTTNPSVYADGDRANFSTDKLGRQLIRNMQVRDLLATAYTSISTGTETTILTAGAGTFLDCIWMMFANTSGVAQQVDIRAVSGGNVVHTAYIPASSTIGWAPPVPWPQDATGNAWTADGPDNTNSTIFITSLFTKEL